MRRSIRPIPQIQTTRLWEIDAVRGIAIIMMVIYHFMWDLRGLGGYDINVYTGFWHYFQLATASLFTGLVGLSLTLSYNRARARGGQRLWRKFAGRGIQIFSWGLVVGIVTFLFDPPRYVRFGILHLIGTSIILAYPFLRFRWLNLVLGVILLLLGKIAPLFIVSSGPLDWLISGARPRPAFDYFPLIPWFGVVLIGIFLGNLLYRGGSRRYPLLDDLRIAPARVLRLMGQNSLLIYLLHQPIMITILTLLGVVSL
ncbi:MAG: DUF1624 domain-containing protein [Caldilineae bacterium]|nr:MAG: DUF1624 domain-containing protein [Caldilineae bacterium]